MTSYLYLTDAYEPLQPVLKWSFSICNHCSDCCKDLSINQSGEDVPMEVIEEVVEKANSMRVTCEVCSRAKVAHLHLRTPSTKGMK